MPAQWQNVPIPLFAGVDTKTDSLALQGKMRTVQNAIFDAPGTVRKRPGYSLVTSPGAPYSGQSPACGSLGDELLVHSGDALYGRSGSSWITRGSMPTCRIQERGIGDSSVNTVSSTLGARSYDVARANGFTLYTWAHISAPGGVYVSVIRDSDGTFLFSGYRINSSTTGGSVVRCVALGTRILVVWSETTANKIIMVVYDTSAPTSMGSPADLVASRKWFNIVAVSASSAAIVTVDHVGTDVDVRTFNQTGVTAGPTARSDTGGDHPAVAVDASGNIFAGYAKSGGLLRVIAWNSSLTELFAPISADTSAANSSFAVAYGGTSTARFIYENGTTLTARSVTVNNAGSVTVAAADLLNYAIPASKPATINGKKHMAFIWRSQTTSNIPEQPFVFLWDLESSLLAGVGIVKNAVISGNHVPGSLIEMASGAFAMAVAKLVEITTSGATSTARYRTMAVDFDATAKSQMVNYRDQLFIAAGVLYSYANGQLVEHGFLHGPEITLGVNSASGGSLSDGTYSWIAVYSWVDAGGNKHYSLPSTAVSSALSGGGSSQSVPMTIKSLLRTSKSGVLIEIYRTEDGGTTYYLEQLVNNAATATTAATAGAKTDAALIAAGVIYSTGEVENTQIPPPRFIGEALNRLWSYAGGQTFYFSKPSVDGRGVEFAEENTYQASRVRSPVALVEMDMRAIVLGTDGICWFSGDGPDAAGNGAFSRDVKINSSVGCADPESVVVAQDGVFFKSTKGIYLLDRSLELHYVGADVETYNSYAVTSARVLDKRHQVVFTLSGVDSPMLVYDYLARQWCTWTVPSGLSLADACQWADEHTYLTTGAAVYQQGTGFTDNSAGYQLKLRTGWLRVAGLQGFMRTRRAILIGTKRAAHNLVVVTRYDGDESSVQTFTFDASDAVPSGDDLYQFRTDRLSRQKCETISFEIYDNQSEYGANEGYSINELQLESLIKGGSYRHAAAKTIQGA